MHDITNKGKGRAKHDEKHHQRRSFFVFDLSIFPACLRVAYHLARHFDSVDIIVVVVLDLDGLAFPSGFRGGKPLIGGEARDDIIPLPNL